MKFPALPRGDWEPPRAITPKPFQDPHPPCWVAATSEESIELAAKYGLGVLSVTLQNGVDACAARIQRYRDTVAAGDATPITRVVNNRFAPYTLVHCYNNTADADAYDMWGSVAHWYTHLIDFTVEWELPPMTDEQLVENFPILKSARNGTFDPKVFSDQDMIIIGDHEECLEKFERYQSIGCDATLCSVQFGHPLHESIMTTLDLLGTKVIPKLAKKKKVFAVGAQAAT